MKTKHLPIQQRDKDSQKQQKVRNNRWNLPLPISLPDNFTSNSCHHPFCLHCFWAEQEKDAGQGTSPAPVAAGCRLQTGSLPREPWHLPLLSDKTTRAAASNNSSRHQLPGPLTHITPLAWKQSSLFINARPLLITPLPSPSFFLFKQNQNFDQSQCNAINGDWWMTLPLCNWYTYNIIILMVFLLHKKERWAFSFSHL